MAQRRFVTTLALAAGSIVGGVLYRRRTARRRERIDLYYDDGSMLSLSRGSPDVARLLPLAREVLDAARP